MTHKAAPPALVLAQERDPALWHQQEWLHPLQRLFLNCLSPGNSQQSPLPGLSSYFLPCVWVMREWRRGWNFDRGQAKTKDWLALKTPGNVYAWGGYKLHTHPELKKIISKWTYSALVFPSLLSPHSNKILTWKCFRYIFKESHYVIQHISFNLLLSNVRCAISYATLRKTMLLSKLWCHWF